MIDFTKDERVSIFDLVPLVTSIINGADQDMVAEYLISGAIQFCSNAQVYRRTICVKVEPCVDSYFIDIAPDVIKEVLSFRYFRGGNKLECSPFGTVEIENNMLYLAEPPQQDCDYVIEVELSLAPSREASTIPKFLYEHWAEPIVDWALMRLFMSKDSKWVNLSMSREHRRLYDEAVKTATIRKITEGKPLAFKLKPRWGVYR